MGDVVYLNIGGVVFVTRASTITQSSSFFSTLLQSYPDAQELFVDRDPTYFRYLLNWMRGVRYAPEDETVLQELVWEADYYCIHDFRDYIHRMRHRFSLNRTMHNIAMELKRISQTTINPESPSS